MSILKNRRLREVCQIHSLYQQFRCTDKPYLDFLQYIRYSQPQQYVLDNFQRPLLLFHQSDIPDYDIWHTVQDAADTTFLTVSRVAANWVNSIVIARMFQDKTPVSTIPLENDVPEFFPFRDMRVVVTQNLDKCTGMVNGQLATIQNNQNNTLLLRFPNGKTIFTYPVTTSSEDGLSRVSALRAQSSLLHDDLQNPRRQHQKAHPLVWLPYCAQRDGIRGLVESMKEWGYQDLDPDGSWPVDPSVNLNTYSSKRLN